MKKINNTKKPSFLKKLFVKLCRLIGFEIIDQSNLNLPVSNRLATDNLGSLGEGIITIPLGETKISRSIKSLDIIIKTCTSVNLVTQNKKRIFEEDKSEYTFRTINSLINSLKFGKEFFKNINIKIYIIDHNSKKEDLDKIKDIIQTIDIKFEIIAKKPEIIIDELINQKLDIGITFSQFFPKSIRKLSERKISMGAVTSIGHPLQLKDKITFEDLKNYPVVLHTGALSFFRQTNRLIGLNPDFLDLRVTSNSLNFITKSLINNKDLVTLSLSSSLHELYTDSLIFREIENETTLNTRVGILCLSSRKFTKSEEKFNELLIKEFVKIGKTA